MSEFGNLDVLGEENSIVNACTHDITYCVVKKCTVHSPCIMSIHCRTDFKFEYLLHIIETKCVSEFDLIDVLGEINSIVNVCTHIITV